MSIYTLTLVEDKLPPRNNVEVGLPSLIRILYVVEGDITINSSDGMKNIFQNHAWLGTDQCSFQAGIEGAKVWRWELTTTPTTSDSGVSETGHTSLVKEKANFYIDPDGKYIIRCDRVDFPPSGIAYTHIHWGPGIRCLLDGKLTVRDEKSEWLVLPGESWFERGPDPIYAQASTTSKTSFVRVMVLPHALKGQTSIRYIREEDQEKPKPQQYTRFVDDTLHL